MIWYDYEFLRTSTKKPADQHLIYETSGGDIYMVDSSDITIIIKSDDNGATWTTVLDVGYDVLSFSYDSVDDYLWFVFIQGDGYYIFAYIDLDDDSYHTPHSYVPPTNNGGFGDLIVTATHIYFSFCYYSGLGYDYKISYRSTNRSTSAGAEELIVLYYDASGDIDWRYSKSVLIGSYIYSLVQGIAANGDTYFIKVATDFSSSSTTTISSATLGADEQTALSYDNDDLIYFIINEDADGEDYLYTYSISTDTITKGPQYDIALMMDRNTNGGELERAFSTEDYKIYQIATSLTNLYPIGDLAQADTPPEADIIAITDNFIFDDDGKMFTYTDKEAEIKAVHIYSSLRQAPTADVSTKKIFPTNLKLTFEE